MSSDDELQLVGLQKLMSLEGTVKIRAVAISIEGPIF
jgi:hypothetical protein